MMAPRASFSPLYLAGTPFKDWSADGASLAGRKSYFPRFTGGTPQEAQAGVMAALARGFSLPSHFGANLDALYDSLTDLEPEPGARAPGLVLVVERLPGPPGFDDDARDALLDVFRDAADAFGERGVAFRTFWSVSRGARPASP